MVLINKKKIFTNTLMLYMRMLLLMPLSLYTSRLVLEYLGVSDFGLYGVVGGVLTIFSFITPSLVVSTQRFLSFEIGRDNNLQLKRVFSVSMTIHMIFSVFIVILGETVGLWFLNYRMNIPPERIFAANCVYQCSILSSVLGILSVPYSALITAREKMNVFAYIGIMESILRFACVFMLTYNYGDMLISYGVAMLLVAIIVRLVYQIYCRINFPESEYNFVYDKAIFSSMLSFSAWSLWGGAAYSAKNQGVNIVLNIFCGTVINAAWGVAQQVNTCVLGLVSNFSMAMYPSIIKSHASNNRETTTLLLFSGMKFSFFLTLCTAMPLISNCQYVFSLWLPEVPDMSVYFTQALLLILVIESVTHSIAATVQATGRIKWYQMIVGCVLLLNLPLSFIFMKFNFSPIYVLYIALFLSLLCVLARYIILFHLVKYPIFQMIKMNCMMLVILSFNYLLFVIWTNMDRSFIFLIQSSICIIIVNFVLFYVLALNSKERHVVFEKLIHLYTIIRK